jgi:hypothetical protein
MRHHHRNANVKNTHGADPVLLGCAVLECLAPGQPKSLSEIAAATGTTRANIFDIERRALCKLRRRLGAVIVREEIRDLTAAAAHALKAHS